MPVQVCLVVPALACGRTVEVQLWTLLVSLVQYDFSPGSSHQKALVCVCVCVCPVVLRPAQWRLG